MVYVIDDDHFTTVLATTRFWGNQHFGFPQIHQRGRETRRHGLSTCVTQQSGLSHAHENRAAEVQQSHQQCQQGIRIELARFVGLYYCVNWHFTLQVKGNIYLRGLSRSRVGKYSIAWEGFPE